MFHIISSNHLEVLASGLAGLLGSPPESPEYHPLQPEVVLVQSKGMQRWISMAVARINGICANVAFPFPNAFLQHLYGQMPGPLPSSNPFDPPLMTFRILHLLPRLLPRPEFESLRDYLTEDPHPLKAYQLARSIADLLDQYSVYRPEMLRAWEAGTGTIDPPGAPAEAWQAGLWRHLATGTDVPHRAAMHKVLVDQLADATIPMPDLPARLAIFGISHLPPFHLQALEALAQRLPVYLFLLNPCRHYWSDILSDRQMSRLRPSEDRPAVGDDEALHLDRGNRLLASLGLQGKHFFDFVHQIQAHVNEVFRDNPDTLLGRIQQDILDLVDRADQAPDTPRPAVHADGSLRIHSCHSPMREVEVLHDQLLDMLTLDPNLEPRDILVMTPDIGRYAPYIHAVFGAAPAGEQARIPYTVADRNMMLESPVVQSVTQLLELVDGRFEASRVMALLECPAVQARFGLCAADLPLLERWVRNTGICWGWNGTHRRRHHLPGFEENTWRNGLDRLVMGYAMSSDQTGSLFAEVLPYDGIGPGEERLSGRLVLFAETLYTAVTALPSCDTPDGWYRRLRQLLDTFFDTADHTVRELQSVQGAIEQLGSPDLDQEPLTFDVVRQHIRDCLGRSSHESGFIAGGVTFCAMLPMRSIPAQIICLLGMDHDAFPRQPFESGFNLIALMPRRGDRSRRSDDRYLFLETLISARQTLYLSYVGRDIQDNSPIPPSVMVDELVEYVHEDFGIAPDQLVTHHPLHPFSPDYFDGSHPRRFSYCRENLSAAGQLFAAGSRRPFFEQPLPPPPDHWRRCVLDQLTAFFGHPTRFLMMHRLGVHLRESPASVEDRERFNLDPLDRYTLNQHLLQALLAGTPSRESYRTARAAGLLPHGTVGKVLHRKHGREVRQFIQTAKAYLPDGMAPESNVYFEMDLDPFELHATIDCLYPQARVVLRLADTRPKDLLNIFLYHLAMQAGPSRGRLPDTSILVCRDTVWRWGGIEKPTAEGLLRGYLDRHWQGMHKPLLFFSRTSFEYAQQLVLKKRTKKAAMAAALRKWSGNDYAPGESSDPYFKRCFAGQDPLTPEFEATALGLFEPLLRLSDQQPIAVK